MSNNAVAISHEGGNRAIFSFMGIGPKKTWDAITTAAFQLDLSSGKWKEMRPVPGTAGRLGASAAALHEQVFLFGGYVVDGQGGETTLSDLNVLVPVRDRWYRGADIPVPVDDSVLGVYKDRFIYLVGGWSGSKTDAVRNVQVYDTEKDNGRRRRRFPALRFSVMPAPSSATRSSTWTARSRTPAVPTPGTSLRASAGWAKLPRATSPRSNGRKLPDHPGGARYRIAAGASEKEGKIYFSGGTDNPYNYNGIGYNGQPAEPSPVTFAFNVRSGKWETVSENTPDPTMDHRGLLVAPHGLVIAGGMEKGQQVTARVRVVKPGSVK